MGVFVYYTELSVNGEDVPIVRVGTVAGPESASRLPRAAAIAALQVSSQATQETE
jgi:hypothetical protein